MSNCSCLSLQNDDERMRPARMFKFSCLSLCKLLRDGRAPCLHNNLPNSFANSFTTDSTCTLSTTPQTRGPQLFHSLIIHFANCLSCANCSPTLFRYLVISGKLSWNVANTTYMITRQTCSSPFESRRVVEPLELNVPSLQVFFWMPREQSFVEIAQKADITIMWPLVHNGHPMHNAK